MDLEKIKKIHFVGIGGIMMSAVALLIKKHGKDVSGSDSALSGITNNLEKAGIKIYLGHQKENFAPDTDFLVYSSAVPESNPERQEAEKLKVPQSSLFEFLGELSKNYGAVTVCGTKGKTTTTILAGLMLEDLDPTVLVGGKVKEYGESNLRIGGSYRLVMEACEWQANFLHLQPQTIVLTNLEAEHLDYYRDLKHIVETFKTYAAKLPDDGYFIFNIDNISCAEVATAAKGKLVSYGINTPADVMAREIKTVNGCQSFELLLDGDKIADINLRVPGLYSVYNALASAALAIQFGVKFTKIKSVLESFTGSWRRFEKLGERDGATFISDYAHTPTSIKAIISAARQFYSDRRIVAVFQPHLHNRTKTLFKDFTEAFDESDLAIISDIYFVKGRVKDEDKDVSSKDLADAIGTRQQVKKVLYGGGLENTKELVLENIQKNDLVLIIGAGDIDDKFRQAEIYRKV